MSENRNDQNCNHHCEGCSVENCGSRNPQSFVIEPAAQSVIRKKIGIVSGKGGVGKSFVTSMLASEMARRGHRAAVLDGDITGPSQAMAFGIHEKAYGNGDLILPAVTKNGIQVISTNMLLDSESQPVIWRGPMVANILKQFYQEVYWEDVDYMFIDMPPGTSDVPLTLFQSIPLDVRCPNCDEKIMVFGHSHIHEVAEKYNLPVLAQVPLDVRIASASDAGTIEDLEIEEIKPAADFIEKI